MMQKYNQIAEFGKKLLSINDINDSLVIISQEVKKLINADRCSIFMVDAQDMMLWTKHSDGIGRIVIALDVGVVGDTYKTQEPQIVNTPYDDPRFLQGIDKKSGYVTKNMITVPIFDSSREVIGVIQLLNRSRGDFTDEDLKVLTFFSNYISGSLELILMNDI